MNVVIGAALDGWACSPQRKACGNVIDHWHRIGAQHEGSGSPVQQNVLGRSSLGLEQTQNSQTYTLSIESQQVGARIRSALLYT